MIKLLNFNGVFDDIFGPKPPKSYGVYFGDLYIGEIEIEAVPFWDSGSAMGWTANNNQFLQWSYTVTPTAKETTAKSGNPNELLP